MGALNLAGAAEEVGVEAAASKGVAAAAVSTTVVVAHFR